MKAKNIDAVMLLGDAQRPLAKHAVNTKCQARSASPGEGHTNCFEKTIRGYNAATVPFLQFFAAPSTPMRVTSLTSL